MLIMAVTVNVQTYFSIIDYIIIFKKINNANSAPKLKINKDCKLYSFAAGN